MRPFLVLTGFCGLFSSVGCVPASMNPTDQVLQMVNFNPGQRAPVWHAETKLEDGQMQSITNLYIIANAHFNWVKTQQNAPMSDGSLLVAAVWDPTSSTVFASTIPRGGFHALMVNDRNQAPVWRARSDIYSPQDFHAEDAAYYMFEVLTKRFKDLEGDEVYGSTKYSDGTPDGMMVATWGRYPRDDSTTQQTGRPINLCDGTTMGARVPSCQQVAKSLGVYFEVVTQESAEQAADDNNEEYNTGLTDQDLLAVCDTMPQRRWIPRGDSKRARQVATGNLNISCTSTVTLAATYSPTPLTITLNGTLTNYSLTTTPPPVTTAPAATLSCSLQDEEPDQGITEQGCICGTTTLPVTNGGCSYTEMPSTTFSNPLAVATSTWTSNCQACTLVGGIADKATCTTVSACTPTTTASYVVWLSNNTISLGTENNKSNGSTLRNETINQLRSLCPDTASVCDSTKTVDITISNVVEDAVVTETVTFTIQDSSYESIAERDRMLIYGISTWQQAVAQSCQTVNYTVVPDGGGCPKGPPIKRDLPSNDLDRRIAEPLSGPIEEFCHFSTTVCSGPDNINPVFAGSSGDYTNHMNIQLAYAEKKVNAWDAFICTVVIDVLSALALEVAPEAAAAIGELDLVEQIDFQAICEGALS